MLSTARTLVVPAQITRCGRLDLRRIFRSDLKSLGMKLLAANRLKCSEADVQRHVGDVGAGAAAGIQNLGGKVQSGGRRSDRASLAREHGLVALAILSRIGSLDIRR